MRLQKSNLKSSCLRLTLRPSDAIQFLQKKKVTQEGGLATLTKKDWIHLIYFLTNALCNFLKRKEIIKVGGFTPLVKKDWFHLTYI